MPNDGNLLNVSRVTTDAESRAREMTDEMKRWLFRTGGGGSIIGTQLFDQVSLQISQDDELS